LGAQHFVAEQRGRRAASSARRTASLGGQGRNQIAARSFSIGECTHWKLEMDSMGNLLHWAVVFLVVALVAAFLGFGGVAGTAMEGARLLFWVAVVFLVVSLVIGLVRRA
jgi:uncharacterized membrane protein YtjA (UPF0391 family)